MWGVCVVCFVWFLYLCADPDFALSYFYGDFLSRYCFLITAYVFEGWCRIAKWFRVGPVTISIVLECMYMHVHCTLYMHMYFAWEVFQLYMQCPSC